MAKSIFLTRHHDIMSRGYITALVLHLHDKKRWPLDQKAYFAKLKGDALVLASAVIESHLGGDPEFRRYAEALAAAQR